MNAVEWGEPSAFKGRWRTLYDSEKAAKKLYLPRDGEMELRRMIRAQQRNAMFMPLGYQATLIGDKGGDGGALANTVTATSILGSEMKYALPGNFIDFEGKKFRIRASGRISNIVTTPGTFTYSVRWGPTANIIVATGPAFQLNAVAKTNVTWVLDWAFTVRTVGGGTVATMMHTGVWQSESVVGSPLPSAGGAGQLMIPASAPAVGTGFDSTAASFCDLFGAWSIANAGNTMQLHQYALESMN